MQTQPTLLFTNRKPNNLMTYFSKIDLPQQLKVQSTLESAALRHTPQLKKATGVAWAGTHTWKGDFNKRRDEFQEWTEYLFRN